MKNKQKQPIQLALYGMDERTYKTMSMYLKGPCKGIAVVVDEFEAEIDLIDADHIKAKDLLEQRKEKTPERPIILLSLESISIDGTIYVKKPVKTPDLIAALKQAKDLINKNKPKNAKPSLNQTQETEVKAGSEPINNEQIAAKTDATEQGEPATKRIDQEERKKSSKHRTAKDLTEGSFSTYIGLVEGVDFSDPKQVINASYNAKGFFLGYVQAAIKTAKDKGRILRLNSGWKPLIILPYTHEVWLDVDDKQLRAFAGLAINSHSAKSMSLSSVELEGSSFSKKMEGFHDVDNFLWKLAIWTSKGRYPKHIDIHRPVYLKQWPNFTRLVVTPHAMRIAALLIRGPRTAMSIANDLKIKPQFVFVFISAANVLGLLEQATRQVDEVIAPAEVKPSQSKGLLNRILGRLRG